MRKKKSNHCIKLRKVLLTKTLQKVLRDRGRQRREGREGRRVTSDNFDLFGRGEEKSGGIKGGFSFQRWREGGRREKEGGKE